MRANLALERDEWEMRCGGEEYGGGQGGARGGRKVAAPRDGVRSAGLRPNVCSQQNREKNTIPWMRLRVGHRRASQLGGGGWECLRALGGAGVAVSVPSTRVEGNCMQFDPESTTAKICDSRKHSTRASVRSHVHTHYTSIHVRARMRKRTRAPTRMRTHLHEPAKTKDKHAQHARDAHARRCRRW